MPGPTLLERPAAAIIDVPPPLPPALLQPEDCLPLPPSEFPEGRSRRSIIIASVGALTAGATIVLGLTLGAYRGPDMPLVRPGDPGYPSETSSSSSSSSESTWTGMIPPRDPSDNQKVVLVSPPRVTELSQYLLGGSVPKTRESDESTAPPRTYATSSDDIPPQR